MSSKLRTEPGLPYPLGASFRPSGVNFSIFSHSATGVQLLLFDRPSDRRPAHILNLDPRQNRTVFYWHIFVEGLSAGQLYAFRVEGPLRPSLGHRFDATKVLIDPYARAVTTALYDREAAKRPGDNCPRALRGVVVDPRGYDWDGDAPLQRPYASSVIYEMHVGGFTRHPSSGLPPHLRGTYAGLIEKIPYLLDLGVTAVELLPVQQFDEQDGPNGLPNYWGYSPLALFAPHRGYSSRQDPQGPVDEFRDMVKALHRAGIEVILDVVFNHTAESDVNGPTLSFRGLENEAYYILDERDPARYADFTGCGNTLNGNLSIVRRLIIDCLHYWVQSMHVDGFRFDLASVLARDEYGQPLRNPPILWEIDSDPVLSGAKIIAEAWDAAGLYQVGSFIGHRWAEWNGRFRDDLRRFVKSDPGQVGALAQRLTGSRDLYRQADREPNRSINFITAHDGFTLHDLTAYDRKHNLANRQQATDGSEANLSWNCGAEGETSQAAVLALRARQWRNLLCLLFLSEGTPMLLMGDETARSQGGNNNAFCQDNETSWFDWSTLQQPERAALLRFTRGILRFSQSRSLFQQERFWATSLGREPSITWHGIQLNQPDWSEHSHSLAFLLDDPLGRERVYVMLNAYWEALEFQLPPLPAGARWTRVIDTAQPSPHDYCDPPVAAPQTAYTVQPRSSVILLAKLPY